MSAEVLREPGSIGHRAHVVPSRSSRSNECLCTASHTEHIRSSDHRHQFMLIARNREPPS